MPDDDRTDETPADAPDDEGPITPEVVPPAGATRRRRGAGAVRIAASALIGFGAIGLLIGVPVVLDPAGTSCSNARHVLESERTADEDAADDAGQDLSSAERAENERLRDEALADLDSEEDIEDLTCDEASGRATLLAERAGEADLADAGYFRIIGLVVVVTATLELVGAIAVLKARSKPARRIAVIAAVVGAFVTPALGLGIVAMLAHVAIIYGLVYSADARATFGNPGGRPPGQGGLFRPRPPVPKPDS